MKYNTHNDREKAKPEKNSGKSLVETQGYVPAQIRIENMMLAGKRLSEFRKEMFDFGPDDEVDENLSVPVRRKNFDLAEASQMAMTVSSKLRIQQKRALEASQNAQNAQEESSVSKKGVNIPPVTNEPE